MGGRPAPGQQQTGRPTQAPARQAAGMGAPPNQRGGSPPSPPSAGAGGPPLPAIFDVASSDFQAKVVQGSFQSPILLDLWAPWCGPCKQLTPILEQAVKATGGRVKLAKLNTDENADLAQALKVSSLPTVLAVYQGKTVDQFVGLQSAQKIQEVVMRLLSLAASSGGPGGAEADPDSLDSIGKDVDLALQVLEEEPTKEELPEVLEALKRAASFAFPKGGAQPPPTRAEQDRAEEVRALGYAGLIKAALSQGEVEAAKQVADQLRSKATPGGGISKSKLELARVKAALAAAALAQPAGEESEQLAYDRALQEDPGNHNARLSLAKLLFSKGLHSQAVDEALELLKRDRTFANGAARTLLLDIFNVLGPASPVVKEGRRKMSSVLLN